MLYLVLDTFVVQIVLLVNFKIFSHDKSEHGTANVHLNISNLPQNVQFEPVHLFTKQI